MINFLIYTYIVLAILFTTSICLDKYEPSSDEDIANLKVLEFIVGITIGVLFPWCFAIHFYKRNNYFKNN